MKAEVKKEGLGEIYFDWEKARSIEGYYRIRGCNEFCSSVPLLGTMRTIAFGWRRASQ